MGLNLSRAIVYQHEEQRIANENLRINDENNRINNENVRSNSETTRNNSEIGRQTNETTRQSQETTRQSNETARQTAETNRQNAYNQFVVIPKTPVSTFTDIATTYTSPSIGWQVVTLDTGNQYRWSGSAWINNGNVARGGLVVGSNQPLDTSLLWVDINS